MVFFFARMCETYLSPVLIKDPVLFRFWVQQVSDKLLKCGFDSCSKRLSRSLWQTPRHVAKTTQHYRAKLLVEVLVGPDQKENPKPNTFSGIRFMSLTPTHSKHTPSKLVPEGRDEAHKRVPYKQKLGVTLELQRHQVTGQ